MQRLSGPQLPHLYNRRSQSLPGGLCEGTGLHLGRGTSFAWQLLLPAAPLSESHPGHPGGQQGASLARGSAQMGQSNMPGELLPTLRGFLLLPSGPCAHLPLPRRLPCVITPAN